MNFERMWFELKNKAIQEIGRREFGPEHVQRNKDLLELMSRIEVEDARRSQEARCGCQDHGGRKGPDEKEHGEQKHQDMNEHWEQCKKKGAEILAKIFGNDYVDNLDDLEKKLLEKDRKICMVAGGMEIPESLMNLAREKKISIVHANCEAVEIGRPFPFPFPFPPEFMK